MPQLRRVLTVVLLVVLIPASASAQGVLRWLGRLSGPGPFWGVGGEFGLVCYGVEPREQPLLFPGKYNAVAGGVRIVLEPECRDAAVNDRYATIFLNVGASFATDNPLSYGAEGSQSASDAVRMLKAGLSADWTFHKAFDVGAGFGMLYFAGPRFANFSRGYVQPIRLGVRPLMFGSSKKADGWLVLAANWQIIVGTLDGADFGAPLDPFRSRNEQDVELGVTVDVIQLKRRFFPASERTPSGGARPELHRDR